MRVACILVLLAAIVVAVSGQGNEPDVEGTDIQKLAEVIAEFEKSSGKKVHFDSTALGDAFLVRVTPVVWQRSTEWLRNGLEGALLRKGLVLLAREDGDFEITKRADAKPAEVDEAGLAASRDDAWVRVTLPAGPKLRPATTPTALRCVFAASDDGTLALTGYAREVRLWHKQLKRTAELENGIARTYTGLALEHAEVGHLVRVLFPGEASVEAGTDGPVITAAPQVHARLKELLPERK